MNDKEKVVPKTTLEIAIEEYFRAYEDRFHYLGVKKARKATENYGRGYWNAFSERPMNDEEEKAMNGLLDKLCLELFGKKDC